MANTVVRTRSAREYHTQQEHYLYQKINFNTPMLDTTMCYVGVLPANALPLETIVRVTSALTSGALIIGTTANTSAYVEAGDVVETTTGVTIVDRCAGAALSTVALPIMVRCTGATAGEADIWVRYLPAK